VAKGCDSRNIVTHILENKIKREQVVHHRRALPGDDRQTQNRRLVDGEIMSVSETEDTIKVTVTTAAGGNPLTRPRCCSRTAACAHRNPVIHDELVADPVQEQTDVDRYADVKAIEAMGTEEKWQFFEDLLSPCIRCYACRNACPLCYCPTCFVDESKPQWVGKGQDPLDVRTFHFLRAYHCAGRCTDCGACERACPVGINMRTADRKLKRTARKQFGWEAGLSLDQRPALDSYNPMILMNSLNKHA
jgi:formate dehydrogenase subunit beta